LHPHPAERDRCDGGQFRRGATGGEKGMVILIADWLTDYFRRNGKVIILTFFTYAALC